MTDVYPSSESYLEFSCDILITTFAKNPDTLNLADFNSLQSIISGVIPPEINNLEEGMILATIGKLSIIIFLPCLIFAGTLFKLCIHK